MFSTTSLCMVAKQICITYKSGVYFFVFVCSMMEYDTENMNSEEIYSSLRGVTEAIQSFSYRSQEDLNEPIRQEGKRDDAVSLRVSTETFYWIFLLEKLNVLSLHYSVAAK